MRAIADTALVGEWAKRNLTQALPPSSSMWEARSHLSAFVTAKGRECIKKYGDPLLVPDIYCPHNLTEMLFDFYDPQQADGFRISVSHCDGTIYTSSHANVMFRYWHDMLHIESLAEVTFEDEVQLGAYHTLSAMEVFGYDAIETKLMYIDTIGQTLHECAFGRFPANQLAFAVDMLVTGKVREHA